MKKIAKIVLLLSLFLLNGCTQANKIRIESDINNVSFLNLWAEISSVFKIPTEKKPVLDTFKLEYNDQGEIVNLHFDFYIEGTGDYFTAMYEDEFVELKRNTIPKKSYSVAVSMKDFFRQLDEISFTRLEHGYSLKENERFSYYSSGINRIDPKLKLFLVQNNNIIEWKGNKDVTQGGLILVREIMKPISNGWKGSEQLYFILKPSVSPH